MKPHRYRVLLTLLLAAAAFTFSGCSGGSEDSGSSGSTSKPSGASHSAGSSESPGSSKPSGSSRSSGGGKSSGGSKASGKTSPDKHRETNHDFLCPEASGTTEYSNDTVSIDASNSSEGYVMVEYSGNADRAKLQVTTPDETVYTYNLAIGSYETFPLPGGSGSYHLDVYEHVRDSKYATLYSQDIEVSLSDDFKPFLYPNQYVWYTKDDDAVAYGVQLSDKSADDLDYVVQVYHYVTENITYDTQAAENIPAGYLPDIDRTMASGKGICFDYASLMTALLRSQGVPTKLIVGYSGTAYHAWISVYLKETGWVDNVIQFDGKSWTLMDPTLAASADESSVKQYIGDGSNYTVKYSY